MVMKDKLYKFNKKTHHTFLRKLSIFSLTLLSLSLICAISFSFTLIRADNIQSEITLTEREVFSINDALTLNK